MHGQKLIIPSDTSKKSLANCSIALQYLKQFDVPLYDDDEMVIVADDIANGNKELTLSLVWNIFVHLQVRLSFGISFHRLPENNLSY